MPDRRAALNRVRVGHVVFQVTTLSEAANRVIEAGRKAEPIPVRLANAYCVALASKDPKYRDLLNGTGLNYPDGAPVVWFMHAQSGKLKPQRVRGPSLFELTLSRASTEPLKHFFLGTTDETLLKLQAALKQDLPNLQIAGMYAPPFAEATKDFIDDCEAHVKPTNADYVWIGLGTPKQDYVAKELSVRLTKPCIAVGAAFDFRAGTVREAPHWMQKTGTEWLYRFTVEPKRLWRRYVFGNIRFLYSAVIDSRK
ncbi:WecB/TagA/CpsF family glycosyltransferase [Rhodococcus sp. 14-1411-2a]|uniref:WecB/TagA/CpsF family glycosyltransferase n=1 Tax=Rhodococcus sp. 14-1411-2a TaxID=2023151 RepID=UPI000B9B9D74|nr:WecB/TagA/CpsF family glycosyltransferase [Rhodococcus sp. 14-1411-2a]OZF51530.1 glycosyltransferase [Rhodococcus sp. 14-1411-2a]